MFDLRIYDLSKTEDEEGYVNFISLTNEQWNMIKTNIDLLKNHKKCELMYAEDFKKSIDKARADMLKDVIEIVKCIKKTKWHWKKSFSNVQVYEEFVDYDELIYSLEHIADTDKKVKE